MDNLQQQNFSAYLPLLESRKRQRGAYRLVTEPFFPRYLFVQFDEAVDNWGLIRSTRGVAHLVRFGTELARVPDEFITLLREREDHSALTEDKADLFQQGEAVKILTGPFAGMEAVYQAKKSGERAIIMLQIANKYTQMKLSEHELGKV